MKITCCRLFATGGSRGGNTWGELGIFLTKPDLIMIENYGFINSAGNCEIGSMRILR